MRARFQPLRRLTVIAATRVCAIAESAFHHRWANTHAAVGDATLCPTPAGTIGAVGMQAATAISVGGHRTLDVIGGKAHRGHNDFGEPVDNTTVDRPPDGQRHVVTATGRRHGLITLTDQYGLTYRVPGRRTHPHRAPRPPDPHTRPVPPPPNG